MKKLKLLLIFYVVTIVGLFFYSFTQVDLNLTLSQLSIYQTTEKIFQHIGFFQRPLSTLIFIVIASLLFLFYFYFLKLSKEGVLDVSKTKIIIFITFLLLVFSYNAFSYDLFNYIFDARIVTYYHQNPFIHTPYDFSPDPMLNFMRWTHRVYPYGPSWLGLTIPLSFIGGNIFLFTFFLFKFLMGFSYLGCSYLIYKISSVISPNEKLFNTIFWSLNPLVIIEGLVSAHNDFPMIFFALLSIYLLIKKKNLDSIISYLFSVGIKFSTGVLLPLYIYAFYLQRKSKEINWEKMFQYGFILSIITVLVATLRTTFQPWYLIFPFTMAAFIPKKYYVFIPVIVSSIFSIIIYTVYVYMTDYAKPYPSTIQSIQVVGVIVGVVIISGYYLLPRIKKD